MPGPQVMPPFPAPSPARASSPPSLLFPTRNKQPAVPAAAARDAKRAPGASPEGGGPRGPRAGPGGTQQLAPLPPRSGAGPGQGRRETGLSARPPSPPSGPAGGGGGGARRGPTRLYTLPRQERAEPGPPQPAAAGGTPRCAAGSELRIRTSLAKTVSAPQCTAAGSL